MFIATNRIRVKRGTGHKLEERFASRAGVEQQAGFLGFEMGKMRASRGEDYEEYLIVTHWQSQEHQQQWVAGEAFKEAHAGPRPDFVVGHPKFRSYDVRLASGPNTPKSDVPPAPAATPP